MLAKLATNHKIIEHGVFPVRHLKKSSIKVQGVNAIADNSHSWMAPIYNFLSTGELPAYRSVSKKIQYQTPHYVIMDGKLYRRGLSMPYLRCIAGTKISAVVHGGFYRDQTSGPSLFKKILQQGYFWPTMKKDCMEYMRKCEQC
ncbi:hypothetical protein CsatB_001029 [Cannabis sativa]